MSAAIDPVSSSKGLSESAKVKFEVSSPASTQSNHAVDAHDGAQFRAAMDRHFKATASADPTAAVKGANKPSLSDKIMGRASELAGEIKKDQEYVSRMLEQATRTGDSMMLMKAMFALNDYQTRVQFVSKTVAKATTSLDQLTKLQ